MSDNGSGPNYGYTDDPEVIQKINDLKKALEENIAAGEEIKKYVENADSENVTEWLHKAQETSETTIAQDFDNSETAIRAMAEMFQISLESAEEING